jgi:hypothetical protein
MTTTTDTTTTAAAAAAAVTTVTNNARPPGRSPLLFLSLSARAAGTTFSWRRCSTARQ